MLLASLNYRSQPRTAKKIEKVKTYLYYGLIPLIFVLGASNCRRESCCLYFPANNRIDNSYHRSIRIFEQVIKEASSEEPFVSLLERERERNRERLTTDRYQQMIALHFQPYQAN